MLAGLIDENRGWGRAGRDVERARFGRRLGRGKLVSARRLRPRPPSHAHVGAAGRSRTVGDHGAALLSRRAPESDRSCDRRQAQNARRTPAGTFPFQEWFVGRGHRDEVDAVEYEGADDAEAAPAVLEALDVADAILLAPSNPYLSIWPILAVQAIREAIEHRKTRCVAVSPLVGGAAVTGPAGRMLSRMAGGTSPRHLADRYKGIIDALVIDETDAPAEAAVELIVTKP